MGGPVSKRGLQLIAYPALRGQCQALLRNRGSGDVSAQALQLVALIGPSGNAGVSVESSDLTHSAVRLIHVDRRQGLQAKDLAPGLRPQRNAIAHRMPLQHTEWIVIRGIQGQIVVLGITFQPALPFQVTPDPVRYRVHQLCQFCTGGFIDSMETSARALGASVRPNW